MKRRSNFSQMIVKVALVMALLPIAAAQGARIRMPDFAGLADKAKESVDIALEGEQLKSAGPFLGGARGGNDAQVAQVLSGLEGIFIKAFQFDKPGQYSMRDLDVVIRQVERDGWKKLLSMREGDERIDLWMRDNDADGGMLLVVGERTELVLINIVGNVNLQTLSQLQGRMGIPNLPGVLSPAPAAAPYAPAAPKPSVQPQRNQGAGEAAARAHAAAEAAAREAGMARARAERDAERAARDAREAQQSPY